MCVCVCVFTLTLFTLLRCVLQGYPDVNFKAYKEEC